MYSKIKIAGHPVHPMLVAFPVAFYARTLVGFAVYAANGHLFWLNLAIALSVAGTGTAVLAALAGLADWALGIPRDSAARMTGLLHAGLNVTALGLFLAAMASYVTNWNGPPSAPPWASCCPPSASRSPSPPGSWAGRWCRTTTSACT